MSFWNDERLGTLRRLWQAGYSSGQISDKLGTTRSAVIGKVYREKLQGGSIPGRGGRQKDNSEARALQTKIAHANKKLKRERAQNKPFPIGDKPLPKFGPVEPYVERQQPYEPPMSQRVNWDQLQDHHCRFVIGDPSGSYQFCGGRKLNGISYCEEHAKIVFKAPEPIGMAASRPNLSRGGEIDRVLGVDSQKAVSAVPERETEDA